MDESAVPKKRLGRPPKALAGASGLTSAAISGGSGITSSATGSSAAALGEMPAPKRRGRPPLNREAQPPKRIGRPPGPARLAQLQQMGVLPPDYVPPLPKSERERERDRAAALGKDDDPLSDIVQPMSRDKMATSVADSTLTGVVVLDYPPHPWRWAPGFRRGEIVWTEMTHPLIRKSAESGAVMESGASAGMLWPVEVVDRWISDPRQPVDTRLAIIQEAADGHEVSGFDVAVVPEDMAIQTNLDQGCHVDLLETIARTELRNLEADEGAGGSDWSPVNGKTERVVIDSDAMEVSAERNRFLRPPGGGGGSGSNAPSTVAAPSPSAEMSEGSDEEGRKHPKRIVIAGAPRRGKHAGAGYKALLSSHVTLQDPTGSTAPARVVSTRGGGSKDAPVVSADAKMTRKRRLAELEGQPRPLEVHYVLRPLPLSDLGIAANSAVAWEEDEVAKDGQRGVKVVGLASGCFYGSAEEVLPFALYNPDCRDDVLWNVAAMQAVDVAGSFGIPQNPGEDAVEPELCNVWGAVVEAMNLPPRPIDNIGLLSANAAKELTSIKLNADSSYKGPHSFNAANASSVSSPASSDAEEGDLEGSDDEETAGSGAPRKIVKKDVWGLKKESHLVPALLRAIGSSNWVGNDAVQPPKLGRFDTFIQRFRLGSERMQVGDLVRLGGRRLMGRQTQKKALVVPRGTDFERLVAAQRRRFERGGGIPSALNGVFEPGMEDKTVPLHRSLQQVVLKINEAGIAVVETIPPPEAPPLPVEIPPAGLGSKGDPEAPYGLSLPTTDGVEYLEISYIVLRRPKPITPLAWRGSVGTHGMDLNLPPLTGPAARPSVLVTGRVYHRIASDGRASRDVPLWFPTGEVRTVNAVAGEVLCRVHSQFPNANLTGVSATGTTGGWNIISTHLNTTTTWTINVGGVGQGWKGAGGAEETTFSGNRLDADLKSTAI